MRAIAIVAIVLAGLVFDRRTSAADPSSLTPEVATLLEDNAAELLPLLTNPTGDPGQGLVEKGDVFSGESAIKIIPMQRFSPNIPGWKYKIVERPSGRNEFRYLRFAWKAGDGCIGIMLQMHDEKDWSLRWVAGIDAPGWGSKQVAEKPPTRWTVVTRDLFADFGERTIQGIALTAFEGQAAYFDHIYFGRTIDDLDRIAPNDAAAAAAPAHPENAGIGAAALEKAWADLCSDDARKVYRSRATFLSNPTQAAPFLMKKAQAISKPDDVAAQVEQWLTDLDADEVTAREVASEQLARHIDSAAKVLQEELGRTASPEVRVRISAILSDREKRGPWPNPAAQAVRVLQLLDTPEAREALRSLADGDNVSPALDVARGAIKARDGNQK